MRTLCGALLVVAVGCAPAATTPAPAATVDAGMPDADPEIVELAAPASPPPPPPLVVDTGDLEAIQKRGTLRVLVFGQGELLLPRAGKSTLSDRELAAGLAASLGVTAEPVSVERYEDLIPLLLEGKGDIIAARLAETAERKQRIVFSRPTAVVEEFVVGRVDDPAAPKDLAGLAGKTVTVRKSSSYRETLDALIQAGASLLVGEAAEDTDTATIVEQVAHKKLDYTVVDGDLLAHIQGYVPSVRALFAVKQGRQIALGIRPTNPKLKAAADAYLVQTAMTSHARKLNTGDLDVIRKRGSLRMITRNDATSYHLYKGQQRGFDYELTRLFAQNQGLRLDVLVVDEDAELVAALLDGRGDVIAAQLVPSTALSQQVALSVPYLRADDELAQKSGVVTPVVWGVRKENNALRAALDRFMKKTDRSLEHNVLRARYFGQTVNAATKAPSPGLPPGTLSAYDDIFRARATQYGLDWRLVASQAFQESGFDPRARSWVGAQGLMQVMPATGVEMGFKKLEDPDEGAHAGVRYLAHLIDQFERELPFKQRVRFALAAYNAGKGHVDDARALAAELGLNPNKWFKNVEKTMLLLQDRKYARRARHGWCRGEEPVKYVSEIQSRYDNYLTVVRGL